MIDDKLRDTDARFQRAEIEYEEARKERNAAIREAAHDHGYSHAKIAGILRTINSKRVGQIAHPDNKEVTS